MSGSSETERVRRFYDGIAGRYDEYVGYTERWLLADGRRWVCSQARGDVLEVGIGTGRNLPFYPADARLTGVDLTPRMLDLGRRHAVALGLEVEFRVGDAQSLNCADGRFDTVVATLVLSAIPDVDRMVAEVWRVLRPGGRVLLLDFVRSPLQPVRLVQRVLNPLFDRRYAFHLLREPLDHLEAAGFVVERVERSKWGFVERVAARKPTNPCANAIG